MDTRNPSYESSHPSYDASTSTTDNPSWWTDEHTSRWDRMKEAFRRDWEQTKANFADGSGMNLRQSATDTLKQATGSAPVPPLSQKTRPANRAEADQAQKKMTAASKKAAKEIAKAQDDMTEAEDKIDDAVARRDEATEEWSQAEQEARYGFAARSQYPQFAQWDAELEQTLSDEWGDLNPGRSWEDARAGVRRGWDFSEPQRH